MLAVFLVIAFTLLGTLALLVVSRSVRSAVLWSGPIGVPLGLWLLGPMILRTHHLHPTSVAEWAAVAAILVGFLLLIGVVLALFVAWPLAIMERVPGLRFDNPHGAAIAWIAAILPMGYLGLAAVLEWSLFSRLSFPDQWPAIAIAVMLVAATSGLAYRGFGNKRVLRTSWLIGAVTVTAGAGLVRLVLGTEILAVHAEADLHGLTPARHKESVRPLLVIGLDGGDWRVLRPLIENGKAPTLARLAAGGIQGQVEALWPPYWSTPAWASIVTGYPREQLGVYENLGATAPGLPPFELPLTLSILMNPVLLFDQFLLRAGVIDAAPADRRRLRRPPVWERASDAGVRTGVVFFPFTYPAIGQTAYVVSNRTVADLWDMLGVQPGRRDQLVSAPEHAEHILQSFEQPLDHSTVRHVILPEVGRPRSPYDLVDPVDVLSRALDVGERMFNISEQFVSRDPELQLMVLYVGDFDSVCHAFWPYRFPEDYPSDGPGPGDVTALGPVIDRYLSHLDDRIGRLIETFHTPPNVLIVADHGFEPSRTTVLWRAWHSRYGLFIAGGPDVRGTDEFVDVSYLDVAPTIVDLLGFEPAGDLRGRSILRH